MSADSHSQPQEVVDPSRPLAGLTIPELVQGFVEVGTLLSGPKPLAVRMKGLCAAAAIALRCDRFNVMVIDGDHYRAKYHFGQPAERLDLLSTYQFSRAHPVVAAVEQCDSYLLYNDARVDPHMADVANLAGVESVIFVPFTHPDGSPFGYVTAEYLKEKRTISIGEAELAMGIAKIVLTTLLRDLETQRRREISAAMFAAADIERSRLSREIHDESLQQILGLRIGLESFIDRLEDSDQKEEVERFISQCRSVSSSLREVMAGEHPAVVTTRSLEESLNSVLQRTKVGRGVTLTFSDQRTSSTPNLDMTLLRIGEQAVRNALVHASPSRIAVRIAEGPDQILFTVTDDGRGFDPDDVGEGRLGLVSMRERTELLDGTFLIESSPDTGTTISASFSRPAAFD